MGYVNRDRRLVRVTAKDTRYVRRLRRRAERRELRGEPIGKTAGRARRRGWWYA
jgi:hypothetical protein